MCRGFGMGFGFGGGAGLPWMLGMGISRVLVAALVIFLIYKLIKGLNNTSRDSDRALEILNERYVNGEIDDEEYEKMKKRIR
ncbi:putative membrane protein [Proteiniborus ethanoligenes]|uniref:Putative membrane protein n=1 Tax=Proteiniborus ethanoligenes TaxID=415015 RepID=A0A1H3PTS7_9FIRM|nr:SHOCT domain-containing protein [Proteiniborus ethanoligenes]SDZ04674.1 putative membrane protein [Proteiniborus ethanoligenes]